MDDRRIRIFRLEDADGLGPWHGRNTEQVSKEMEQIIVRSDPSWMAHPPWEGVNGHCHPAPEMDPLIGPLYREPFDHLAFESIDQFKDWFRLPEEREVLSRYGIKLVTYEVPEQDAIIGEYQIAFNRAHAVKLDEVDPTTIH